MQHFSIDPRNVQPPTRDLPSTAKVAPRLPDAKEVKGHPAKAGGEENASIYFVGTATTILEWEGIRLMTDPNFLHAGDHVHLGPGVSSTRRTNPAVDLHELPRIDLVLLSHYHAYVFSTPSGRIKLMNTPYSDHFDQKVEQSLRRDLPIISTPHAKSALTSKPHGEAFSQVFGVETYQQMMVNVKSDDAERQPRMRMTAMPGKHVPTNKVVEKLNEFAAAVPPTNGWMLELGYGNSSMKTDFNCGYRVYISGDTLMVDELKEIPQRYAGLNIDLMLVHLGGTTIPTPALLPMALMVTMDGRQGVELMQTVRPEVTIPIHYDDYEVFASPLEDFRRLVEQAGLSDRVVYLDRSDLFRFRVQP
ncbi:hypothetical protein PHISP_08062 [Aspergillus sp. HF37]|nr:hypothetical protein PHISP_08062 [Aspergillus sp. HF37]